MVGPSQDFSFKKVDPAGFKIPQINHTNLYIHIPFCTNMCPYCPYNRIKYENGCEKEYMDCLLKEIELYYQKLGKIEISTIYIGGGTPTNLIDGIPVILERLQKRFHAAKKIAIETSVSDINKNVIKKCKDCGINMVSVGVQSFHPKYLKLLGRNYNRQEIEHAVNLLKEGGFDGINIDLIFLFPGQTKKELLDDITMAKDLCVDQVTAYPLFTFPYSAIGQYKKINRVISPNVFNRRRFYRIYHDFFMQNGYKKVSVWSFTRKEQIFKYSSVTRQYYIGMGAGAGSRFENKFYFNTFSVNDYQKRLSEGLLPVSITMTITEKLSNYYRLYWKLYEGLFTIDDLAACTSVLQANLLLKLLYFLKFCRRDARGILLTEKGSFWIHLIQNYFILNYINKVWSVMKKEPFPSKILI